MKGPEWMPLNIADYLKDTAHLSTLQHGAYLLLIMRYWADGGLPNDEEEVQMLSGLTEAEWASSRKKIKRFFDDQWRHKRVDAELARAAEIISKRKAAGQQRHSKSSAHAEHDGGKSLYAGVPPSPLPEPEDKTPPSHSEPGEGGRDLFDEIFKVFPRNPQSSEGDAYRAFRALGSADQGSILAAAQRYAKWFGEDCVRRKRSEDVGRDFVPKFSTWLTNGAWREAGALPLNADAKATVIAMVRVDRTLDAELFAEIERLRGKKAPSSPWSFPAEVVEQARQALKAKAAA